MAAWGADSRQADDESEVPCVMCCGLEAVVLMVLSDGQRARATMASLRRTASINIVHLDVMLPRGCC